MAGGYGGGLQGGASPPAGAGSQQSRDPSTHNLRAEGLLSARPTTAPESSFHMQTCNGHPHSGASRPPFPPTGWGPTSLAGIWPHGVHLPGALATMLLSVGVSQVPLPGTGGPPPCTKDPHPAPRAPHAALRDLHTEKPPCFFLPGSKP